MSADSSMGAHTSNTADATSQNDINDAAWNPVGDSPVIAPVSATTEVPPIEEVLPAEQVAPAEPVKAVEETAALPQEPVQDQAQEVLSTSITNLRVDIPEPSESDDDMPPLISSSENSEEESDGDSKEESESDSKVESDDSKDETDDSKDDTEESEDNSGESEVSEENAEESNDSDEDLMVAVFQRPTCQRCDAALKALLTPSEDESETETSSESSDSSRAHRIRPKPTEIPTIILTLFKILLFLHIVQFLTTNIAPARRTYS